MILRSLTSLKPLNPFEQLRHAVTARSSTVWSERNANCSNQHFSGGIDCKLGKSAHSSKDAVERLLQETVASG